MSKITLENEFGTYTIDSKKEVEHINDVMDYLVMPLLLAAGYQPSTIKEGIEDAIEEHKKAMEL